MHAIHKPDETGMPDNMRTSYERLKDTGAYLLDDGACMFLWIGKNISSQWLYAVLGATNFQTIDFSAVCSLASLCILS
jgi:protein transport protein SEC24